MDSATASFLYACVGERVLVYRVDTLSATLERVDAWTAPGNVQYGCFDPERALLYLAFSDGGPADAGQNHGLIALRIDAQSGALSPHGPVASLPFRPIHCTLSPDGTLIATVFNRPAGIMLHTLAPDGAPGAVVEQPEIIDLGVCPHQARFTPTGRHLIVSERGTDTLSTLR